MVFRELHAPFGNGFGKWFIAQEEFDENRDLIVHLKVVDEPAEGFGIDNGKIIKLEMRIGNEVIANYDRGWDVAIPEEAWGLYMGILKEFN